MPLIHHLELGAEVDVPGRTIHIWQRSGWKPGPLPQVADHPPVDETHPTAPEEGDDSLTEEE